MSKALKSCPKSNKSPNLVTLIGRYDAKGLTGSDERSAGDDEPLEEDPPLELESLVKGAGHVGRVDPEWHGREGLLQDVADLEVADDTALSAKQSWKMCFTISFINAVDLE